MMKCRKCSSTRIKSRSNYSHGKKSSSTTYLICKECGSADIEVSKPNNRRGRRK